MHDRTTKLLQDRGQLCLKLMQLLLQGPAVHLLLWLLPYRDLLEPLHKGLRSGGEELLKR